MAGIPTSREGTLKRTLRFALGTAIVFSIAQLFSWPLSQLAPPFAVIMLIEAEPVSVKGALKIIGSTIIAILCGYFITLFLIPYPLVLILVLCLLLYRFFIFILTSGAHLLNIVGMLIGLVCIPVATKLLPELAVIISLGMVNNFIMAIICAWTAFLLIPAPEGPFDHHHEPLDLGQAKEFAGTMTLVAAPMLIGFLMFGWTSIVVLVYTVLIAPALSPQGSAQMGWDKVVTNLIFGGVGMWLFYEAMVAAPNFIIMMSLAFAFCFVFGSQIFSGRRSSELWLSGMFGFLILIGGALLSESVVPTAKAIDRVYQIGLSSLYVVFAYHVVDLFKAIFSRFQSRFNLLRFD